MSYLTPYRQGQRGGHSGQELYIIKAILYDPPKFEGPSLKNDLVIPSDKHLLDQIQAVETSAIKIAFQLPPWATNHWCYKLVIFDQIINRIKSNAKKFFENNAQDELIQPLIENKFKTFSGQVLNLDSNSPIFNIFFENVPKIIF